MRLVSDRCADERSASQRTFWSTTVKPVHGHDVRS